MIKTYYTRLIDKYLKEWAENASHKPLILRGARQVGKSSAVRHLGKSFNNFVEINFERNPEYKLIFENNLDVKRIVSQISAISGIPIKEKETLLFFDEIQECPKTIMSLRFFWEELPELHVISAGSLLEFAFDEIPTFGVGRIHSMFMYPMTFDEFLLANGKDNLIEERNRYNFSEPLPDFIHKELTELFRVYMIIGGMPEVVNNWVTTGDYLSCQQIQDDLLISFEADFSKYNKKIEPDLLLDTLKNAAIQLHSKFIFSKVSKNYKIYNVKKAVDLLTKAGLLIKIRKSSCNGLPLGSEADENIFKLLLLDSGLTLRLLNMTYGNAGIINNEILTSSASELVNKGVLTEMMAALEILRYKTPNLRHELFYWSREERNSLAEIDYVTTDVGFILPIEIKAGVQGGMKSMWTFLNEKDHKYGLRSSFENFGIIRNGDKSVMICPLFALSQLSKTFQFFTQEV